MTDRVLTIVGMGPGAPDLVTVRGTRALREADIVFLPRGDGASGSLAGEAAREWLDPDRQRIVEFPFPMAATNSRVKSAWDQHAATIEGELAGAGPAARGAFPLLGDPMLFGSAVYLLDALTRRPTGIDVRVIPGITSFGAAASAAGATLAIGDDSLVVVSGKTAAARLESLLEEFSTVVVLKLGRWLPEIQAAARAAGATVVYAERLGMPGERVTDDLNALTGPAPYFSLVIARRPNAGRLYRDE